MMASTSTSSRSFAFFALLRFSFGWSDRVGSLQA